MFWYSLKHAQDKRANLKSFLRFKLTNQYRIAEDVSDRHIKTRYFKLNVMVYASKLSYYNYTQLCPFKQSQHTNKVKIKLQFT